MPPPAAVTIALEDIAFADVIYRRALAAGVGRAM